MRTGGVDLSANPRFTGVCTIDWRPGAASVSMARTGCSDDELLEFLVDTGRVGVDSPFGWPRDFVAAIAAHETQEPWPGRDLDGSAHRDRLRFRATDRYVREATGMRPLSVSTDRIGVMAMRWALLADRYEQATGTRIDRAGTGKGLLEVYPAAALQRWGYPGCAVTGPVDRGRHRADWLRQQVAAVLEVPQGFWDMTIAGTAFHSFDAVVAALNSRAAALGLTDRVPAGSQDTAQIEGWIHLPRADSLPLLLD